MALAFIEDGIITKYPIGLVDIRRKFPNTSFSKNIEDADLTAFGVVTIHNVDQPTVNFDSERIEEGTPAFNGTQWNQVWNVVTLSAEEQQQITDSKAARIRADRNKRLADTDWRVTYEVEKAAVDGLGVQLPTVWSDYRQALRDITTQAGFPHNVTWPEEPST